MDPAGEIAVSPFEAQHYSKGNGPPDNRGRTQGEKPMRSQIVTAAVAAFVAATLFPAVSQAALSGPAVGMSQTAELSAVARKPAKRKAAKKKAPKVEYLRAVPAR